MTPLQTLNKKIDTLNDKAKAIQSEYQEVGVECIKHHLETGDVGPINRLYVGMPKGQRKVAMGSWLLKYAAIRLNKDNGTKDTMVFVHDKDQATKTPSDPVKAMEQPWFDLAPERDINEVFDLQVAFKALLNRASKATHLHIGGKAADDEGMALLRTFAAGVGLPPPAAKLGTLPVPANDQGVMTTESAPAAESRQNADGEGATAHAPARTKGGQGNKSARTTRQEAALA